MTSDRLNLPTRTICRQATRSLPALLFATLASLLLPAGACAHTAGPYSVEVACDWGGCPEVAHRGSTWVVAEYGSRYSLRVWNHSHRWVEAVVSVDGRDVLNGARTSAHNRGYLIPPGDSISIDGWRQSDTHVAAFRFTSTGDSYAGRMDGGAQAGRIEVRFFPGSLKTPPSPVYVPRRHPRPDEWWGSADDFEPGELGAGSRRDHNEEFAEAAPSDKPAPTSSAKVGAGGESAGRGVRDGAWMPERRRPAPRQELGTQYGESRWSEVSKIDFSRDRQSTPDRTAVIRYDSASALTAKGILPPDPWAPRPSPRPIPYSRSEYVPPPPR